ncbi:MAG: glycosyltransferase family 39 protein [Nitrospira sp.]|nr:glycosyltransferase family 39 protein [Nitrospira sp.]
MSLNFSVIIPTLNEVDNIDALFSRLFALNLPQDSFEVIVVDDGSSDDTPARIRAWEERAPVRLIERREKPDLTASILAGVSVAHSDVIVVMDADLSHPPEQLPALVLPVRDGSYDVAIGSRYVPGGSTEGWPVHRRWLSRIGAWLARSICDVRDPTAGFFAFRRELAGTIPEEAHGFKILLELLMAGHGTLKVVEVPICFRDRTQGVSKLSLLHQLTYLKRVLNLAGGTVSIGTASRFAVVGLFGILVDALLFGLLMNHGAGLALAHITSFLVTVVVNYILNAKWSFRAHHTGKEPSPQFGSFLAIGGLALLMRGEVLALLVNSWHVPAAWAIVPATAATAAINYLGSAFYVWGDAKHRLSWDVRWRTFSFGLLAYILLLRLLTLGQVQLLPHEAYYWNYAQHMDLSFLDHPPMVAWLIWLGTTVMGNNEFGVRIGAFFSGLIAMGYLYALARNRYDASTGMRTVLLVAVLPLGAASGMLMTPDAPLLAAWAATLYYMERALVAGRHSAWVGLGIAFGLGILSKYTLVLLGGAGVLFILLDPKARRWIRRPQPYLAVALALLLFSPVIIWNVQHHWASILFQSVRRFEPSDQFSLHILIIQMLVMLTPTGLLAVVLAFFPQGRIFGQRMDSMLQDRYHLFVLLCTAIPLTVFFAYSVSHSMSAHLFWTAPLWLAVLPTMAWMMGKIGDRRAIVIRLQAIWKPTIVMTTLLFATLLHYLVLGLPGVPYVNFLGKIYFWDEASMVVERLEDDLRRKTGQEPMIIGMTKFSVASSLAFYDRDGGAMDIRSRNTFGRSAVMYDLWFPSQPSTTRPIILVGANRQDLDEHHWNGPNFNTMLHYLGPILSQEVLRDGKLLRHVYYRIAQGYLGFPHTQLSVSAGQLE